MTKTNCKRCGVSMEAGAVLQGMCTKCLMELGMEADSHVVITGAGAAAPAPPPSPAELQPLFPNHIIDSLIGQGGMGVVYKATQKGLDRKVALKVLPAASGRDPEFAERFQREAKALASLNHPNITSVFDFGKAGEHYYLAMELVDGLNLRQLIASKRVEPKQALQIIEQICDALQYAHDEGVVHRDIKPENILMDRKGRLKITDFGLAKLMGLEEPEAGALTLSHQVMGTPHYMAPEQVESPGKVDHRADIYSLGVVFYELLTGELPLGRFAPPSGKVQVDVRLDEVVLRALEKEPALRYQTASAVKTDVHSIEKPGSGAVAAGGGVPREPVTAGAAQGGGGGKPMWPWVVLAIVALLTVPTLAVGGLIWILGARVQMAEVAHDRALAELDSEYELLQVQDLFPPDDWEITQSEAPAVAVPAVAAPTVALEPALEPASGADGLVNRELSQRVGQRGAGEYREALRRLEGVDLLELDGQEWSLALPFREVFHVSTEVSEALSEELTMTYGRFWGILEDHTRREVHERSIGRVKVEVFEQQRAPLEEALWASFTALLDPSAVQIMRERDVLDAELFGGGLGRVPMQLDIRRTAEGFSYGRQNGDGPMEWTDAEYLPPDVEEYWESMFRPMAPEAYPSVALVLDHLGAVAGEGESVHLHMLQADTHTRSDVNNVAIKLSVNFMASNDVIASAIFQRFLDGLTAIPSASVSGGASSVLEDSRGIQAYEIEITFSTPNPDIPLAEVASSGGDFARYLRSKAAEAGIERVNIDVNSSSYFGAVRDSRYMVEMVGRADGRTLAETRDWVVAVEGGDDESVVSGLALYAVTRGPDGERIENPELYQVRMEVTRRESY